MTPVQTTLNYLKRCQQARESGIPVYLKTDPAWLINMAINRRAGWAESRHVYGSVMPVNGRYPKRAEENLRILADKVNMPRRIVRASEVPLRYRQRLAHRIHVED
ncbi:MAG: hypothetical protein OJF50_002469 [Nitrospira sp.]|nr:hypothetical protein [Nitrospira sp.]